MDNSNLATHYVSLLPRHFGFTGTSAVLLYTSIPTFLSQTSEVWWHALVFRIPNAASLLCPASGLSFVNLAI